MILLSGYIMLINLKLFMEVFMYNGIYLASFKAQHNGHSIVYQDINGKRDIAGDMLDVDLSSYDYIIATPPCNYWSCANYRRDFSSYSLSTKHLLPSILFKLYKLDKPFIVENVRNDPLFSSYGLFDLGLYVYKIGRHTYWSNIFFDSSDIVQKSVGNIKYLSVSKRQGGKEVHEVIERFIETVESSLPFSFQLKFF